MTDAPKRCLAFLIGTRCENYTRERLCRAVQISPSTADRALRLLVEIGALGRKHGGRCTSSKLKVLISLEDFVTRYVRVTRYVSKVTRYVAESDALSSVLNLKEKSKKETQLVFSTETAEAPKDWRQKLIDSGEWVTVPDDYAVPMPPAREEQSNRSEMAA